MVFSGVHGTDDGKNWIPKYGTLPYIAGKADTPPLRVDEIYHPQSIDDKLLKEIKRPLNTSKKFRKLSIQIQYRRNAQNGYFEEVPRGWTFRFCILQFRQGPNLVSLLIESGVHETKTTAT